MDALLNLIIPSAYAETIPPSAQGSGMSFLMMSGIFLFLIYFAVWRPQNKRAKELQALMNSIAKGDEVLTVGGILGKVTKLNDQYLSLAIASNVEITIQKSAIANVLPKGTMKSLD